MKTFTIFLIFVTTKIFSCSCKWEFTEFTPLHLVNYDKIFAGKVLRIDTISKNQISITVFIYKTYWGRHQDTAKIKTATRESMCGYHFYLGKDYLFYSDEKEYSSVDWCGPTRPLKVEYSDTISYYIPSFSYTKINGQRPKEFSEIYEFLKKSWENEVFYLDSISKIENGELTTRFVNGDKSGAIKLQNWLLSDTNYFYFHNNLLKAKGLFIDNKAQGFWHEYNLVIYRKAKKEKTNPFIYYSDIGLMDNGRRKGVWRKKLIMGDKKLYKETTKFYGALTDYH